MASRGRILCPRNLPFSSWTTSRREAISGSRIWARCGTNQCIRVSRLLHITHTLTSLICLSTLSSKTHSRTHTHTQTCVYHHSNTHSNTDVHKYTQKHVCSHHPHTYTRTHLLKDEGLLVPHRVDGVCRGGPFSAELFLGISRQSDDLRLHTCLHTLVAQELP